MFKTHLRQSVTAAALIAVISAPLAMAQTAAPAAPEAPAATAPAAAELPAALQGLGLADVKTRDSRHGRMIDAQLDGQPFRAMLDSEGTLRGAGVKGDAALPQSLIDALLPQAVRDQSVVGQFARINGAMWGEKGNVGLRGVDAEGAALRAMMEPDGTLIRFGRGGDDDDHKRMGRGDRDHDKGQRKHDRGGKHERRGDRGGDHGGPDGWERGERGGPDGWERGERGGPDGMPPRAMMIPDEDIQKLATDAGYTDLGAITRNGPFATIEGVNPQGETVLVEIGPKAGVVRETAR